MIERVFDISFIADMALHEKQIQQNYRPIIAVHKWFARRPGTLFRGLLLSEFVDKPLADSFYEANSLQGKWVADPFMGGGIPLIEANRVNCNTVGCDINPMSYWIVRQEIEKLNLDDYDQALGLLMDGLRLELGSLHTTRCELCGDTHATVKYFLWVKTIACRACGNPMDLFPGYLVAADSRHPKNVFLCPACGQLTESEDRKNPGKCRHCGERLLSDGPAKRGHCACAKCGEINAFPNRALGAPRHRLFALEYHCFQCKSGHSGRFFKAPDEDDMKNVRESEKVWAQTQAVFVPDDAIPTGDETNRLHRWGYQHYREMFNARQLLGLELSARIIDRVSNERVRNALATNLSDLLRYQNMLCRYDSVALKSLDIFSVHGFPVGLIQCESNFLGIRDPGRNACIGSGGWENIAEKYRKAKSYCDKPFEVRHLNGRKEIVPIPGERIGEEGVGGRKTARRTVTLRCGDAAALQLAPNSLDAVFTDPPYYGNVQYAELMDFCYVWLRMLMRSRHDEFAPATTRTRQELTGNADMGRGLEHFAEGLSSVFRKMAHALKPGAPLAFTYHHNNLSAYHPIAVAILDAGLTCSASLPCPAEMGASIHISGTGSSIIDTVFVCRSTGRIPKRWIGDSGKQVAALVNEDVARLRAGHVRPTAGDIRCILYGHIIRMAVWNLRAHWDRELDISRRLAEVSSWVEHFGDWHRMEGDIHDAGKEVRDVFLPGLGEDRREYDVEVSF